MDLTHIKKTFVKTDQNNSGLTCLLSVLKYYNSKLKHTQIHVLTRNNTLDCSNLLKLNESAKLLGFDSEGYEAEPNELKKLSSPVILLVNSEKDFQHFIVCYGYDGRFLIGEPFWGVVQYTEEELTSIWKSKALLTLAPNSSLINSKTGQG